MTDHTTAPLAGPPPHTFRANCRHSIVAHGVTPVMTPVFEGDIVAVEAGVAGRRPFTVRVAIVEPTHRGGYLVSGWQQRADGSDGRLRAHIMLTAGTYQVVQRFVVDDEQALAAVIAGRPVTAYTIDDGCRLHRDDTVVGYVVRQTIAGGRVLWRDAQARPEVGRLVAAYAVDERRSVAFDCVGQPGYLTVDMGAEARQRARAVRRHNTVGAAPDWALVDFLYACGHRGDH